MTRTLIGIVLALLVVYGITEGWPLLNGPRLSITSPTNDASYPTGTVTISGKVANATALTLDGAPVIPDANGSFSSTFAFPKGGSILTMTATDRFGRTITKTREIYIPQS